MTALTREFAVATPANRMALDRSATPVVSSATPVAASTDDRHAPGLHQEPTAYSHDDCDDHGRDDSRHHDDSDHHGRDDSRHHDSDHHGWDD